MKIETNKIILMYSIGFLSAMIMPKKNFLKIMDWYHTRLSQSIIPVEEEKYYKLL